MTDSERRLTAEQLYTQGERAYVTGVHPLARVATVGLSGIPHVMPVAMYSIDDASGAIVATGRDLTKTKRWRDVTETGKAAIVIDDVEPPFRPRGLEIRGRAEARTRPEPAIWIIPERIIAWGLDPEIGGRNARSMKATAPSAALENVT